MKNGEQVEAMNYIVNSCYEYDETSEVLEAARKDRLLSKKVKKQISDNLSIYEELARRVLVILSLTKIYSEECDKASEQLKEKEEIISKLDKYIINLEKRVENVDEILYAVPSPNGYLRLNLITGDESFGEFRRNLEYESLFTEDMIYRINPLYMNFAERWHK